MSAEESELSGTANHEKEGPGGGEANKTAAPKNVNRPVCHNIFPHRPAIPGDLFPKEKGWGGGGNYCNNTEAEAVKFISSKWKDL